MNGKLITFDLDNTLWDVDSVIITAENAMRGWLRQHVPEVVALYENQGIADIRTQVIAEHPELRHNVSRLRVLIVQRSIEACGFPAREAERLARGAFEVFMEGRHQVRYFPGALETLDRLASRYPLAALSNGNADIARLGLDRYFRFSCSAADVGAGKPAPDMFLAALHRADALPHDAVHIGDHLSDDIAGAQAVGMHTVWVNLNDTAKPADTAMPSATVQSLPDLPATIEKLFSGN
jgi:putative hydrolase of the HAD superfamily